MAAKYENVVKVALSTSSVCCYGKKKIPLVVSSDLGEALEDIKDYMRRADNGEPYMVLLNGTAVQTILNKGRNPQVREGDLFAVLPIVSGG
jgi:hypothetical protein